MNLADIQELQAIRAYPCVSILIPVSPEAPDVRQQTPIRVKNQMREAEERLLQEFGKREVEPVQLRLHELALHLDYNRRAQGLALFAHPEYSRAFYLPFEVAERVAIDHNFATRDLVIAWHRSPRYRVLSLTEESAHLYEGERARLHEVKEHGFPVTRKIEGVETELPSQFGVEVTRLHDDLAREYCNRVRHALENVANEYPLPLALVGVERTLAYFDEVTQHQAKDKYEIVARLMGNWEKIPTSELQEKIWPLVQEGLQGAQKRALERAEHAIGARKFALGMQEVWRAAHEGRIDTLLVEDDFHQPARSQDSGLHIVEDDEREAPGVLDDAVDDAIETVINMSGDVVFYGAGQLQQYQRIAGILRY